METVQCAALRFDKIRVSTACRNTWDGSSGLPGSWSHVESAGGNRAQATQDEHEETQQDPEYQEPEPGSAATGPPTGSAASDYETVPPLLIFHVFI